MVRDLKRNYRKVTCRADLGEYKVELVTSFVGEREREQKKTSGVNFSVRITSSVMFNRRTSNSSKNSLRGQRFY